jgi:ATP-dependent Clp protease ATP-binding subunit ClpA
MTTETRIEPALEARLKRMRLRMELPDLDTLTIKSVPASHLSFNKAKTNLLIKRSSQGMPCVVCVDEDLDYIGEDQALAKAFGAAPTQQGWRVLTFGGSLHGDLSATLEFALGILGADEDPAHATPAPVVATKGMLAAWAEDLTDAARTGRTAATLFRDETMEQVAACTLSWQGRLPLILGEPGTGKTNLLDGVAGLLAGREMKLLSVNMGSIMAGTLFESERETVLNSLLREARACNAILALEQAEWALIGVPRGHVLLREALDQGLRLIAATTANHEQRFTPHPLGSRLEIMRLAELCASDTARVLEVLRPSIAAHHSIEIDAEVEHAAVERSLPMPGSLPGKTVKLLDLAAARARLTGGARVTLLDLYVTASRMQQEPM